MKGSPARVRASALALPRCCLGRRSGGTGGRKTVVYCICRDSRLCIPAGVRCRLMARITSPAALIVLFLAGCGVGGGETTPTIDQKKLEAIERTFQKHQEELAHPGREAARRRKRVAEADLARRRAAQQREAAKKRAAAEAKRAAAENKENAARTLAHEEAHQKREEREGVEKLQDAEVKARLEEERKYYEEVNKVLHPSE
jgi:hypothetical protein